MIAAYSFNITLTGCFNQFPSTFGIFISPGLINASVDIFLKISVIPFNYKPSNLFV